MEITTPNLVNIIIHIVAGTLGLIIGFTLLARKKGTFAHRKWGRTFAYFAVVVCLSATVGVTFFRFLPLFAVLTVLVLYQLVSGWRVIYTKDSGPTIFDGIWTIIGILGSIALVPILLTNIELANPTILYSSIGALAIILFYDAIRWFFPKRWHKSLWRYEHTYKLISTLFGMLSAFVGNIVRFGQPWSQILPSTIGIIVIFWFFVKIYRNKNIDLNQTVAEII